MKLLKRASARPLNSVGALRSALSRVPVLVLLGHAAPFVEDVVAGRIQDTSEETQWDTGDAIGFAFLARLSETAHLCFQLCLTLPQDLN